ncbi:MAG: peptidase [Chloroflexota bacterium]
MTKFIYLFLDGVGLGADGPSNPFNSQENCLPFLSRLLGSTLLENLKLDQPNLLFKALDATLVVSGLPQSATGQTALFTGRNAPAFLGHHLTGFANGSMRLLIEESGLFKQVIAAGGTVTSANLYTPAYFEAIRQRKLRYSAGALLSLTAKVPFRLPEDYARGEALFWDITNQYTAQRSHLNLPILTPEEAGRRLARLALKFDVTLFESYLPDFAGHRQDLNQAREVLQLIDRFIEGILTEKAEEITLVISSDHGNIEDLDRKTHTLNPVPLLVSGPDAAEFYPIEDITGITPTLVRLIQKKYN